MSAVAFQCRHCHKTFEERCNLRIHLNRTHSDSDNSDETVTAELPRKNLLNSDSDDTSCSSIESETSNSGSETSQEVATSTSGGTSINGDSILDLLDIGNRVNRGQKRKRVDSDIIPLSSPKLKQRRLDSCRLYQSEYTQDVVDNNTLGSRNIFDDIPLVVTAPLYALVDDSNHDSNHKQQTKQSLLNSNGVPGVILDVGDKEFINDIMNGIRIDEESSPTEKEKDHSEEIGNVESVQSTMECPMCHLSIGDTLYVDHLADCPGPSGNQSELEGSDIPEESEDQIIVNNTNVDDSDEESTVKSAGGLGSSIENGGNVENDQPADDSFVSPRQDDDAHNREMKQKHNPIEVTIAKQKQSQMAWKQLLNGNPNKATIPKKRSPKKRKSTKEQNKVTICPTCKTYPVPCPYCVDTRLEMPLCTNCDRQMSTEDWKKWLLFCGFDWTKSPRQIPLVDDHDIKMILYCQQCKKDHREFL